MVADALFGVALCVRLLVFTVVACYCYAHCHSYCIAPKQDGKQNPCWL